MKVSYRQILEIINKTGIKEVTIIVSVTNCIKADDDHLTIYCSARHRALDLKKNITANCKNVIVKISDNKRKKGGKGNGTGKGLAKRECRARR